MSQHMQFKNAAGNVIAEYDEGVLHFAPLAVPVSVVEQSPQGHVGQSMIDADLRSWTIVDRIIFVDGVSYNWGVADEYLMWDDIAYHRNGTGYIHEIVDADGNFVSWSEPGPDPRGDDGGGTVDPPDPVTDTLATIGSMSGTTLNVKSSTGFKVGDPVIIPAQQPRGQRGPGGNWPERLFANRAQMDAAAASIPNGFVVGLIDNGEAWVKWDGRMQSMVVLGHWYLGAIVPRAYFGNIDKIEGTKWTMSKPIGFAVTDADVLYDGSAKVFTALQNAPNGSDINHKTPINLNKLFPGWKRAAINGMLGAHAKRFVELTCDKPGSFELFSPPGTPCLSVHFRNGEGCLSHFVTLRGNWGDKGYGLNWRDTSTNFHGFHGPLTDGNPFTPSKFPSGHEFWSCVDCVHEDAQTIDLPVRATGGEGNANCWSYRIKHKQSQPIREYLQWMMQYASTVSKCGTVDCEIDSVALLPGFEIMHGHGDIIRPKGRNYMIGMNNASGIVDRPRIKLEKDCIKPLEGYPAWFQYATGQGFGVPAINLNKNAGNWATDFGITLIDPQIDQAAGWLDSNGCNLVGISVQEIPKFRLEAGMRMLFPAKRVNSPKYGGGAVGLQCYGTDAFIDGVQHVEGECINSANNWCVFVTDGIKGPALKYETSAPKSVNFNWTVE